MHNLAIYGTLLNPAWGLEPVTDWFTLSGSMYNLGSFPAVTSLDGGQEDFFEVRIVRVTDEMLTSLDRYEGVDVGLYKREVVSTPFGDAFIYVYNDAPPVGAQPITCWMKYKEV